MEINGSPITAWHPPATNRRTTVEARPDDTENPAARSTESGPLREYISHGEIVQEKGTGDYTEALTQVRRGRDNDAAGEQARTTLGSRGARQALEAYRSNANEMENGGVELLPRVDGYA